MVEKIPPPPSEIKRSFGYHKKCLGHDILWGNNNACTIYSRQFTITKVCIIMTILTVSLTSEPVFVITNVLLCIFFHNFISNMRVKCYSKQTVFLWKCFPFSNFLSQLCSFPIFFSLRFFVYSLGPSFRNKFYSKPVTYI